MERLTPRSQERIDRIETLISTRLTPFFKFVAPAGLAALLVYIDHAAWVAHHSVIRNTLPWLLSHDSWPLLLGLSAALMAIALWVAIPLKRVVLTGKSLRVSNYLTEIIVPLSDVNEVGHVGSTPPRRATIRFRVGTRFGRSVTVIPKMQTDWKARSESEVLEKVRRAINFH